MALGNLLDGPRNAFENLNERERRLVTIMASVFVALLVLVPFYLLTSAIDELETKNTRMQDVLREIQRSSAKIEKRAAERRASETRYRTKAPSLGSFLEAKARDAGLNVREVTEQPDKVIGRYKRRAVRASFPGVSLRPIIEMVSSIEQSPYPVAIERIQIEHFQAGDRYNVTIGVLAIDKTDEPRAAATASAERSSDRDGPPRP